MQQFVVKDGAYVYGSYPEIDALFPLQAKEMDHAKRTAILHKMQGLLRDRSCTRRSGKRRSWSGLIHEAISRELGRVKRCARRARPGCMVKKRNRSGITDFLITHKPQPI